MLEPLRASELLSVIDLLLLNEYDGKPEGYELSGYKLEEYGRDYRKRVQRLINDGYLKIATPEELLKSLTVPTLKDILRANGQKLSGNKSELISRIVKNVQPEKYAGQIPRLYTATSRGRQELDWRSVYVENQRQQYRFLNSEIAAVEASLLAKGEYSAGRVFEELFLRDTVKHGAAHDFGMLGSAYYGMSQFLKRHGRQEESVTAMLIMLYLGLSGMGNNNSVEQYEALSWIMDARVWSDLDKARTALNLSDDAVKAKFDDAVKLCAVKPPFAYFSVETMKTIIIDRLHGQMNLLERYRPYRNEPREGNSRYVYYDFSR